MRHTLKSRMAISTAIVVVVILFARAGYTYFFAYHAIKDVTQAQQDTLVRMVVEQLDDAMENHKIVLRRLASEFAPLLARPADMRRIAQESVEARDGFNAIFVARPDGEVIFATASPPGMRLRVEDRDYFKDIQRGANFTISGLLRGKISSAPGTILAMAIRAPDGSLRGLVGGVLNLSADNFLRQLAHTRVGLTGSYCVVSAGAHPVYVMHPDASKVMTPARATGETCGTEAPESPWELLNPSQPIVARYLMSTTGWEVIATLPADEAYLPMVQGRQRSLLLAGLSTLAAAVLMWIIMTRLLAPLERLRRGMQLGTDPNATPKLPTRREDEIGELARTYADVLRQLREREAALQAAKDRAAESEKRIEAIANHVPEFVSFVDTSERFVFVNHAYARHFRLPPQQIVGLTLRELWGTTEYVACQPYLEQALNGEAVTFMREAADGAQCIEVTYQPAWNDAQDAVVGLHMFARDITNERQTMRRLEAQTVSDHLTGLLNRKGFDRRLADSLARAEASGLPAALLLVDLDDFKAINDTFGHAVGDQLLEAFAQRLRKAVRKGDAVARIGGDEFAVVLDNVGSPDTVERLANTIVKAATEPLMVDGQRIVSSASVGSALHSPGQAITVSELFMRADMALYEAKRHGKGRYSAPTGFSTME